MSFNKTQLVFISIVNFIFGFIGIFNFVNNLFILQIDLFSEHTFNKCLIWILNSVFSILLLLSSIYFTLFIFYNCICLLLISANESNLNFSLSGVLAILLQIIIYVYIFVIFVNNSICNELVNDNLFLVSIYLNLSYPLIILFGTFIINKILNKSNQVVNYEYRQFIDV